MARKQASLRDLVKHAAWEDGIEPQTLWKRVLNAIVHDNIVPILPDGTSLDTPFDHGGARYTWRKVILTALASIDHHIPENDSWAKSLTFDESAFDKWLKGPQIPPRPKRPAGRQATKREAVASFIDSTYPGDIPPDVTNKGIAQAFKAKTGVPVDERTVRRARGRK